MYNLKFGNLSAKNSLIVLLFIGVLTAFISMNQGHFLSTWPAYAGISGIVTISIFHGSHKVKTSYFSVSCTFIVVDSLLPLVAWVARQLDV